MYIRRGWVISVLQFYNLKLNLFSYLICSSLQLTHQPYFLLCSNWYSTPHCSEQNSLESLSFLISSPQFLQILFLFIKWDSRFYYYIFLFKVSDSTLEGVGMEKEEGKNTSKASRKKMTLYLKQCFILDQKNELFQYCMCYKEHMINLKSE